MSRLATRVSSLRAAALFLSAGDGLGAGRRQRQLGRRGGRSDGHADGGRQDLRPVGHPDRRRQGDLHRTTTGEFRFVGLIPGVFEVTATAPKMKTVHQKDINVGINAAAEVNLVMEVETATEEVKVIEERRWSAPRPRTSRRVFDADFIDQIPSDFKAGAESVVATSVPGSAVVGFRGARIRGGAQNQTAFQVEGFNMTGQRSTLKGMAAVEVQSAGYGAENATVPGRRGQHGDQVGLEQVRARPQRLRRGQQPQLLPGQPATPRQRAYFYVLNPNISGPIIKDKLWYFAQLRGPARADRSIPPTRRASLPDDPPTTTTSACAGPGRSPGRSARGTSWPASPTSTSASNYNNERGYAPDDRTGSADPPGRPGLLHRPHLGVPAAPTALFLKSQVGVQRFTQQVGPQMCCTDDPDAATTSPAIVQTFPRDHRLRQRRQRTTQTITRSSSSSTRWSSSSTSRRLGEHDIKLKNDYHIENSERAQLDARAT